MQSTYVQHALVSVQYPTHCAALCVAVRDEAISAASGLDAPIHFSCSLHIHSFLLFVSLSLLLIAPGRDLDLQVFNKFTSIFRRAVRLAERPVWVRLWRGSKRERDWSREKHPSVPDTASTTSKSHIHNLKYQLVKSRSWMSKAMKMIKLVVH